MKYKVRIYCRVPEFVEVTDSIKWEIERENLVIDGYAEITFSSREALFHYVRSNDYVKADVVGIKKPKRGDLKRFAHTPGAIGNHILEAMMTHPNDSRRYRQSIYKSCDYYYIGYLIKDERGRTIDLRNYKAELYKLNDEKYLHELRKEQQSWFRSSIGSSEWYAELTAEFAETEKLFGRGWEHRSSLRGFRTIQERRQACDIEHMPYIRGKRSRRALPEPWGTEIPISHTKSWKDRCNFPDKCGKLKLKHQWQVNIPAHIDTVPFGKKAYAFRLSEIDCPEPLDE